MAFKPEPELEQIKYHEDSKVPLVKKQYPRNKNLNSKPYVELPKKIKKINEQFMNQLGIYTQRINELYDNEQILNAFSCLLIIIKKMYSKNYLIYPKEIGRT